MTDRELMQQAMDALEDACGGRCNAENNPCWQRDIANALRGRVEQPEQEPVAWRYRAPVEDEHWVWNYATYMDDPQNRRWCEALYTTPPLRPWVGLTDAELAEFSDARLGSYDLCLEVEAKLKEKHNG
jgi:hypothetical protein